MPNETIIRAVPTEDAFRRLVDKCVSPEVTDEEAKAFISVVLTVANVDDDNQYHLAMTAARHAFMKTDAFESAFRQFAGYPDEPMYQANQYTITAAQGKEM